MIEQLIQTISDLVHELREDRKSRTGFQCHADLATKHDIDRLEKHIMSAISDYAASVGAKFDAIAASVDSIVTSQAGLTKDVADLKELIRQLQTNPGPISPEDQAILDALTVKVDSAVTRTAGVASALAALDAETEIAPTPTP